MTGKGIFDANFTRRSEKVEGDAMQSALLEMTGYAASMAERL